jgi:hypothetical protein
MRPLQLIPSVEPGSSWSISMSFSLFDIWIRCRLEPSAAAFARLVLGFGCWALPVAILVQVRRRRNQLVDFSDLPPRRRRLSSLLLVWVMVVASAAVLWSQFFVLHPRLYWGGAPTAELRAMMVRDHVWWGLVSALSVSLALTFHRLRGRSGIDDDPPPS